jgi:hypothetical protein
MAYSSNINSTIKYLSSFTSPSSFTSLAITPVAYLPLSTNTSNIGSDGFATIIRGNVTTFETLNSRRGVSFVGNGANSLSFSFNPTSNITISYWHFCKNYLGVSMGLYGDGPTSRIGYALTDQNGPFTVTNFSFTDGGAMYIGDLNNNSFANNIGNAGIGSSPNKMNAWNHIGIIFTMNSNLTITSHSFVNGLEDRTGRIFNSNSPIYLALKNMNRITLGRAEDASGNTVGNAFNGHFKNVMVFNQVLTKTQMLALYTEQLYSGRE